MPMDGDGKIYMTRGKGILYNGPVEYFSQIAPKCPQCSEHQQPLGMFKKHVLAEAGSRPARP